MTRSTTGPTRRQLLGAIGTTAGAVTMYQAMSLFGIAEASPYKGRVRFDGDPHGARVLILGAGLAGMLAALELRAAGYVVEVLEYRDVAGGRCWTLRAGDTYEELGGFTQKIDFAQGNYFNPGPWRIPYHHRAVLDYCQRMGVALEPFIQDNKNAYLHASGAFGGKPVRAREIAADFNGHVAELLSKVVDQGALDQTVSTEDKAILLESLRSFGALSADMSYARGDAASDRRGWDRWPNGGAEGKPLPSTPLDPGEVLRSRLWEHLSASDSLNHQLPMFQPRGGMDMIARAFEREVGDLIRYGAKVTALRQEEERVVATFEDRSTGAVETATADWCVCTIPFSILGQIDHNLSPAMATAIDSMHYTTPVKIGLEFERRFWEEDEAIYGGITYTDLPISMIGYPSDRLFEAEPGVLLGAYSFGVLSHQFSALSPNKRIARAIEYGALIHPQYRDSFRTGVAVDWHRVPWALGCFGTLTDRPANYADAVAMDGRIVLAGDHLSYLPGWMEGALLSSLDAIGRLHQRVVNG
jgi:monoamine oxidase